MLNSKYLVTLLLTVILALSLANPSEANDFNGVHRREHGSLKRLVRKRQLLPPFGAPGPGGTVGAAADPADIEDEEVSSSVAESSVSETLSSASSVTESESSTVSESSSLPSSSASESESVSSSSESSSSVESSTTAESSSSSSSSSSTPAPSPTPDQPPAPTNEPEAEQPTLENETRTRTSFVEGPTAEPNAQTSSNSKEEGGTGTWLTILIVVLSVAVGVTLLWTIFRKWKLGRSDKFDKRLEPIDWAPSNPDEGIIPANRRHSGASSFRSGSGHGHGSNMDHDFTAGSSNLAPVGGYADLARGPSPQPQMNEALRRGPSLTSGPHYDQYGGVPLHHQTGYGATRY